MPGMSIRTGGAWHTVTDPSIRVAGAYQPIQNAWVMVGGVWQQFYARTPTVTISGVSLDSTPCDGGGQFTPSWTDTFAPPGSYFEVYIEVTDSTFGFHNDTFSPQSSGTPITFSLCPDSTGLVTVNMKDSGGTTIATDTVFI